MMAIDATCGCLYRNSASSIIGGLPGVISHRKITENRFYSGSEWHVLSVELSASILERSWPDGWQD